jgi:purine-binding chemotaxis protein CheW
VETRLVGPINGAGSRDTKGGGCPGQTHPPDAFGDSLIKGPSNFAVCALSRPVTSLLAFYLDGQCYALPLAAVERIVRMVSVTPLPAAPEIVTGVINVHGRIIPVVDIRKRFRLPRRDAIAVDQLVIARTSRRPVAFAADTTGLVECDDRDLVAAQAIVPGTQYIDGVAKLKDGMILVHDLGTLLSLEEDRAIADAMHLA